MRAPAQGTASAGFVALYAFAYAALWLALLTPAIVTLALRIQQLAPQNAARSISLVLCVGALVALISNPFFGALSDRTTSRFGRRRPWLVGGALCGLAALALIGRAPTINMLLLGWCIVQLAFNAVLAAMVAILPDQVPATQRGTVVGVLGVCMPIGQIGGTFLVQHLSANMTMAFVIPGAVGTAGVLLFAFVLRDAPTRRPSAERPPKASFAGTRRPIPCVPRRLSDFSWVWLSRVLVITGSAFLTAYQPYFLLAELRVGALEVPGLIFRSTLVQAIMVVVSSVIAGRLSDHTGRRKAFVLAGSVIQGLGLWLIAAANSYPAFLLGVAATGIGHGTYEGVDLALVTEVLPDRHHHAAKDLGILNITNTLPQVIAPLAAPAILVVSRGDFTLLFVVAGCVALLGATFLLPLKSAP